MKLCGEHGALFFYLFSSNTAFNGGENMVELFIQPVIVALLVGSGALCVIRGLELIRDFLISHLDDDGL